jgi:hypothetical protein
MTPLGYIMLPLGLAGLCLSRRWLYRLLVFWTLLSASSAINFGEGENGSALQVWMFFGALWLFRLMIESVLKCDFAIDRRIARPCLWLMAFLLVASLSLIMPIYIHGSLAITSSQLGNGSETPLFFTSHNVTQLLYLIFGGAIAISVAHSNLRDEDRHQTERVILMSAVLVSLWGLLQLFCKVTGLPYPDYIFNNSGSASGGGFAETLNGIGRLSSAATEPSVFAQSLISLLPLTLPAWLKRGSVFSMNVDRACAILFILLLIVCTSSIGYLGLMILGALLVPLLVRTRFMTLAKGLKSAAIAIAAVAVAIGLSATSFQLVNDVIDAALLTKASAGSGLERGMTIGLAFGYFQKFPLLGIGWGSATSHDLIVKLLSNVGVIGTVAFAGAMYLVWRANWRAMEPLTTSISLSRAAWFLSFALVLLTSVVNEFPLAFGYFWLILGMALSTGWSSDAASANELNMEPRTGPEFMPSVPCSSNCR